MPKLRTLLHRLEDFNHWLEKHSKKTKPGMNRKPEHVEDMVENITHLAKKAAPLFGAFIDTLVAQKAPNEKDVRDAHKKAEDMAHHIGQALKGSKGATGQLKSALTMLMDSLTKGLSKLKSSFKHIFSMPDPHQKQPKFAPAMGKHKGAGPQHLQSEKKFKAGQRTPAHVEAHRKVLTTKPK